MKKYLFLAIIIVAALQSCATSQNVATSSAPTATTQKTQPALSEQAQKQKAERQERFKARAAQPTRAMDTKGLELSNDNATPKQ